MAYQIEYQLKVSWIPDGAGPVSVPSAQMLLLGQISMGGLTVTAGGPAPGQPQGYQQVPGADAPTIANFATALNGATSAPAGGMALDLYNSINTNLTRIQGFATGGG
jgi:hypothetical protein